MKPETFRLAGLAVAIATCALAAEMILADDLPDSPESVAAEDVIDAREDLMLAAEDLMQPIDTFTVDDSIDQDLMRQNAGAIAAMLAAVPHLFPSDTNLYDPEADLPKTLALPAVWQSFASFYGLADAASTAATRVSAAADADALRDAALGLRAACDACHAGYLLPYEEPEVTEAETEIDFSFE
jgi:cytochrome c556